MITLHVVSVCSLLFLLLQTPLSFAIRKGSAEKEKNHSETLDQIDLVNRLLRACAILFISIDIVISFTVPAIAVSAVAVLFLFAFTEQISVNVGTIGRMNPEFPICQFCGAPLKAHEDTKRQYHSYGNLFTQPKRSRAITWRRFTSRFWRLQF